MKYSLFLFFIFQWAGAQSIASWNIQKFGASKSDTDISFIADMVKDYDIVALQEIVAGPGGPQAVARLAAELNRKGAKWDYTVSDPTVSSTYKTERYAFLWKVSHVRKKGKAWLEKKFALEIDREPYYCTFEYKGKTVTIANFHAITKKKQPETEIKYFKLLPAQYPEHNLIFVGDFNCPQSHSVFNPLRRMGWKPALSNQKTSLRQECKNNDCLASEYDNIWYDASKVKLLGSGSIAFYRRFTHIKLARQISDHIPVTAQLSIN